MTASTNIGEAYSNIPLVLVDMIVIDVILAGVAKNGTVLGYAAPSLQADNGGLCALTVRNFYGNPILSDTIRHMSKPVASTKQGICGSVLP